MKKAIWILGVMLHGLPLFSQSPLPGCEEKFWTIDFEGNIRQWQINQGAVSGGDTILTGGGTSLSYSGTSLSPTFYSNNSDAPYTGFSYYQSGAGWINIPGEAVNNQGGYLQDQFYMVEGGVIQLVNYWDGANFRTVDSLHVHGEFFASAQDIAVDTAGQAWVFTGANPATVDSLKVYNPFGKIRAYTIHFDQIAFGSFFLNDTLYIGTTQDSLYPVLINGATAYLGNPIYFPAQGFTDMASCQHTEISSAIAEYPPTRIALFPNPTHGYVVLPPDIDRSSLAVFNAQGQLMPPIFDDHRLDLNEYPPGMYFIRMGSKDRAEFHAVMKW